MIRERNIQWFNNGITKAEREKCHGHKSCVIWLTGLSGAGKSTIAKGLQKLLFDLGCLAFVLDGDNIRHGLNADLGFSAKDRRENIRRIGEVAKLFTEAGFIVITAFISPYESDRKKVRSLFLKGDFVEVFIKASVEVCQKRDVKGLYKQALEGKIKQFTGISAPYEVPRDPEMIIDTEHQTIQESVRQIFHHLKMKNIFSKNGNIRKKQTRQRPRPKEILESPTTRS